MSLPRSLGYRLPAEWEPQQAVWLSWPTNRETWPDCWEAIQQKFAEIALVLSKYESVFINVKSALQEEVESTLEKFSSEFGLTYGDVQFFDHPVNDVWVRDHGPIYIIKEDDGSIALSNWKFNGWGNKHPHDLDNQVPTLIANHFKIPCLEQSLVLEGGSIESNGQGDLLVTTDCLLNPNRNPGCSREEIEAQLQAVLGVDKIHWLEGCIEGDDTDGHIDNLVRFFKPNGVLVASSKDRSHPNYKILDSLEDQCRELTLANGESLEVRLLPLPESRQKDGQPLPMSYLNFFVANKAVILPSFGQPGPDAEALKIVSAAFPDREVIPIDCQDLILEGGALHCLTQQVPQTRL